MSLEPWILSVKSSLKHPVFVDLRNIYRPAEMKEMGFDYHSIGRPDGV